MSDTVYFPVQDWKEQLNVDDYPVRGKDKDRDQDMKIFCPISNGSLPGRIFLSL